MILFFCLLLLLAIPAYAGEISESADNLCIASVEEYVNVRKKPSAESDLVGKMYHYGVGRVLATKETDEGVWYRIRSGEVSGYISSDFLVTGEEAKALLPEASFTAAQVIPAELTVYDEPSDTANMLAVVNESTFLDVLNSTDSASDGWTQIVTPYQIEGWVRTDQLRFSEVYSYAETTAQEEERLRQQAEADEAAAIEKEQWDLAQSALGESDETHVGVMEASMAQDEAREVFFSAGGTQEEAEAIEKEILETDGQDVRETEEDTAASGQENLSDDEETTSTEQMSLAQGEETASTGQMSLAQGEETASTGQERLTDGEETTSTEQKDLTADEETEASARADEPEYVRTYRAAVENVLQARQALEEEQAKTDAVIARAQRASVTASAAERVAIEAARKAPRGAAGCEFTTQRDHTIYYLPSLGEELVSYAAQFVGNPYVWGGESLTNGCDCSGFTMLVYARYGIELPHYTVTQATFGTPISEEDLQPGDLVFFERGNYIYHVAIYIGNETIIHAAGTGSGICFSNLHYSTANLLFRRLLKQ